MLRIFKLPPLLFITTYKWWSELREDNAPNNDWHYVICFRPYSIFFSWSMTPNQNLPVKFADDLTLSIRVISSGVSNSNSTANEVQSIVK